MVAIVVADPRELAALRDVDPARVLARSLQQSQRFLKPLEGKDELRSLRPRAKHGPDLAAAGADEQAILEGQQTAGLEHHRLGRGERVDRVVVGLSGLRLPEQRGRAHQRKSPCE